MTKITVGPDCGNAPKREFLKNFNIAFAKGNVDFIKASVTDQIIWNLIGKRRTEGIDDFSAELEKMNNERVSELVLNQILTHGKEGAVSGAMKMQKGANYAFSDFYEFSGAKGNKIKEITSYVIEI